MIDLLYKKKSPRWGECQFLSRLKSQVSLARYYEALFCDLGIDNFSTFVSTKPGVRPFLIKGKVLKSLNQNYNKQVAELRSKGHRAHIRTKGVKRYWRLHDLLHKASRLVINHCLAYDVGHIVIGVNQEWKQEVNLGKRNNQNFVMLPHENLWR